jgi:hypothetical protein
MDKAEVERLVKEKGLDWLIAAMVEGSLGYHSPKHARMVIERALAGETKDYCERCMSSYGTDLLAMIEIDVRNMERLEARNPGRCGDIVRDVGRMAGMSAEEQQIAGLMYPSVI